MSDDKLVARLLNRAYSSGLGGVPGIQDVLSDYFVQTDVSEVEEDDNLDWDDPYVVSDHDLDTQRPGDGRPGSSGDFANPSYPCGPTDVKTGPSSDNALHVEAEMVEPDFDDDDKDSHQDQRNKEAVERATDIFDFTHVPDKKCHCKCKTECMKQFSQEEQNSIRFSMMELEESEKDLFLIGFICGSINDQDSTASSNKPRKDRKNTRIRQFSYGSKQICSATFHYLMNISKDKFTALKNHFLSNGLVPRKKKSGGRTRTALELKDVKLVTNFLLNYADVHGLTLPGRVPGFARDDLMVLPSCKTKCGIWKEYYTSVPADQRRVKLTTFKSLWRQLLPYIVVCKPMTDLCWLCQKNNTMILRSINMPEEEKSDLLKQQQDHLTHATMERSHYQNMCQENKETAAKHDIQGLSPHKSNVSDFKFHYSFDFAQQIMYPNDPLQPSPIYFLVPRRCQVFGVHAESIPAQVNYLIDESLGCGKGANVVISLLHHFLENYGLGEKHCYLNADNCSGQNKNNYLLWYLAWRCALKLHESIEISFLLAGHTKFAPDWCFGLFKRLYRKTRVSCLSDIANVCNQSSKVNQACLIGDETGNVNIHMYNWSEHLQVAFKKLVGVKKLHHFRFSSSKPGTVFVKEFCESEESEINLLTDDIPTRMCCGLGSSQEYRNVWPKVIILRD